MKPRVLRRLLSLFVVFSIQFSCSTDDASFSEESEVIGVAPLDNLLISCVGNLNGYTMINVSEGFGNPIVEFYTYSTDEHLEGVIPVVETEILADCDDLQSGTGAVTIYTGNVINTIADTNVVTVRPAQLPAGCYRWRIILYNNPDSETACATATDWYEAPLF